jgi:hypothetical protein
MEPGGVSAHCHFSVMRQGVLRECRPGKRGRQPDALTLRFSSA